jgi:L-asparaginase
LSVTTTRPISIIAAGGTIAMTGAPGHPASPELDAATLVAAVPPLADVDDLQVQTIASLPSAQLAPADALAIARAAVAEADSGRGVVVAHGTDTLEEVAFLCDLIYAGEAPIVFTGAMRPASAPSADGPGNLYDAVSVAGSLEASDYGVLVVLAGEVHAARAARKTDSVSVAAFQSPQLGPLGRVAEGRVIVKRPLARRPPLPVASLDAVVHILVAGLGTDGSLVEAALDAADADGIVGVLLGAGHTPPAFLRALEAAASRVPVVATVRPKRGAILHDTYAFQGSERDLRRGAIVPAGGLSSAAARMKLMACLGAGYGRQGIAQAFQPDDV